MQITFPRLQFLLVLTASILSLSAAVPAFFSDPNRPPPTDCRFFHLSMYVNGTKKYIEDNPTYDPNYNGAIRLRDAVGETMWIYDPGNGNFYTYTSPVTTLSSFVYPPYHDDSVRGLSPGYLVAGTEDFTFNTKPVAVAARKMANPNNAYGAIFVFGSPFQVCDSGTLRLSGSAGPGNNCLDVQDSTIYGEDACVN